jgi:hypothetical protein
VFAAFSLCWESPDLDPGGRTPHFWGGNVTAGIRARLRLNTHSKHPKLTTMFTVRTISPYKNYSSLLRWQVNMCSYIATTELWLWRYVLVFGEYFILFCCWWTYFVICSFSRTIGTANASLLFMRFGCLWLACRTWVCMKVMVHDGHDWTQKCWSTRGMSGHECVGPLMGMF